MLVSMLSKSRLCSPRRWSFLYLLHAFGWAVSSPATAEEALDLTEVKSAAPAATTCCRASYLPGLTNYRETASTIDLFEARTGIELFSTVRFQFTAPSTSGINNSNDWNSGVAGQNQIAFGFGAGADFVQTGGHHVVSAGIVADMEFFGLRLIPTADRQTNADFSPFIATSYGYALHSGVNSLFAAEVRLQNDEGLKFGEINLDIKFRF